MAGPALASLLPQDGSRKAPSLLGLLEAMALIAGLLLLFWHGVHALQPAIHVHPALAVLFPLFAAAALAALLPLMMFLSFRQEFAALHPAWPPHYLFLARRVFGALVRNNQMKVSAKEL
ncbi:NADH dehydrogenase subunit 6 [Chlorella sorokiniana]|jgi:hypothetical protein|uniref:NADH dehydrogenase subunit 6 n=1 Tax=Chlorella sorokiniana TaxID=3076 RepID=A0A2P6TGF5_CHLSO|nr:NADH dehydrogenase subunit 6 [Chlorella sorokiniana]|eukprot:PRW33202.1 NADH dehydrogenase subunit 6 [Chlorella sorokiniana]